MIKRYNAAEKNSPLETRPRRRIAGVNEGDDSTSVEWSTNTEVDVVVIEAGEGWTNYNNQKVDNISGASISSDEYAKIQVYDDNQGEPSSFYTVAKRELGASNYSIERSMKRKYDDSSGTFDQGEWEKPNWRSDGGGDGNGGNGGGIGQ